MLRTKFLVLKKHGFSLSYESIFDLYQPIVGVEAANLYISLVHEANKQLFTAGTLNNLESFFRASGLSLSKLHEMRSKLEAMGLIETSIQRDEKSDQNKFFFILSPPLDFNKFIANQKFRHLLIKNIGQTNYERLEYINSSLTNISDTINVSSTFDMVYNDQEIQNIKVFNFAELYERIAKNASVNILLSETVKQIIETHFKNFNLSLSEIEKCVFASTIYGDNANECMVDEYLLQIRFKELINTSKNIDVFRNIKLNRNAKMFTKLLTDDEIAPIFQDYMNLNSEQYLNAIIKVRPSADELKIITTLRVDYSLSDYVINMIVDFSLLKTNGKLNHKYIYKVAKTLNSLNLSKLQEIYQYLLYNKQKNIGHDSQIESNDLVKIDWDGLPQ